MEPCLNAEVFFLYICDFSESCYILLAFMTNHPEKEA